MRHKGETVPIAVFIVILFVVPPVRGQAENWRAGVAQVRAEGRSPGMAFVVRVEAQRAYLITSAHVVEGDPSPAIAFALDPLSRRPAKVIHLEPGEARGLALLEVGQPPQGLQPLPPGADSPAAGTSVVAVGFPAAIGNFSVLSTTIASVKGRDLYLSAMTEEGYSGGPLLLSSGAVAGLVYGHEGSYGIALPAADVRLFVKGNNVSWGQSGGADPIVMAPDLPGGSITIKSGVGSAQGFSGWTADYWPGETGEILAAGPQGSSYIMELRENRSAHTAARGTVNVQASSDFLIEAAARGNVGYGVFWETDWKAQYFLCVYPSGTYQLDFMEGWLEGGARYGSLREIIGRSASPQILGAHNANRIMVRRQGPEIEIYFNGQLANRIQSYHAIPIRRAGVFISGQGRAEFSEFVLKQK